MNQQSNSTISTQHRPFLEKVQQQAGLEDLYDARDITEVVFRTMRDVMTTEAADRVASELHKDAMPNAEDKSLHTDVAQLWKDTNPLVAFLSRVRPPLEVKPENFLRRIRQEGGLQPGLAPETAVKAVFTATKDELSSERIEEISNFLPGEIQVLWEQA
jgi:uncharacterized protein (DUF2267 family)